MAIDLIIVGDSHGRALSEGARRLGLNVREVTFSGNYWHNGRFQYRRYGFRVVRVGQAQQQLADLQQELGVADIMTAGLPVLTTMGFHLGRLVPPIGWYGHSSNPDDLETDPGARFLSADFLCDYVDFYRAKHLQCASRMSRAGKLIVVAPPVLFERPNYAIVRDHIKQRLIEAGVELYEPMENLPCIDGVLAPELVAPDGTHGNGDYGRLVVEGMQTQGLL
ncbi:hypothetical protein [Chachezhania sediminis]|uniref:hypothetical protein n=1 Tax=Chachezhania sediminis TaxID=2599291 RepID=UPI00131DB29E|nr:hypothetical protein [Chachezhania sediminis]